MYPLGGQWSAPTSINDLGLIVGIATNAQDQQGMFLYERGRMSLLGEYNTLNQRPHKINNRGSIVGLGATPTGVDAGAFIDSIGLFYELDQLTVNLPNTSLVTALDLNDSHQIPASADDGRHYLLTPTP